MTSGGSFTGRRALQPERTALAWQRTTLGLLANGGLFALRSVGAPEPLGPSLILAVALLALSFVVAVFGWRRERVLARDAVPNDLAASREVAVIGALVVAACAGGTVVLLLPT
ncbi:MAG TPA: DUF202 domain-containing protein [Frankiaceae bacterium]|nr:DUF202 domain-containing protein [Frankiaceae bacterium]